MKAARASATATVAEARDVAKNVRLLRFEVVGDHIPNEAGAHVDFAIPHGDTTIVRSYSVVDDGSGSDLLTVSVKLEPKSRGGSKYMWSLGPGDTVDIVGFENAMPASYGASNYIVVAGGIGVTPLTGLTRTLHRAGKNVRMAYCARSPEEAAFVDMFRDLLGKNLDLYFDSENNLLDVDGLVGSIEPGTMLYMCGPMGLTEAIRKAWKERQLPVQDLRYETFANSGTQPIRPFRVVVEETGKSVEVPEDQSLLETLIESGHEILSDCRRGECGVCKLNVISTTAAIDHRDVFLSPREHEAGNSICCCVSRVAGGEIRVSIDGIEHGRSA